MGGGEKRSSDGGRINRAAGDLAGFVDVPGLFEPSCIARRFERIEITHDPVFPYERAAISIRVAGKPDNLALFIDSVGFAVDVAGKETERLHSALRRPDECLEKVAIRIVRRTGEANNVAALIDVRRRVPPRRAEIAKIDNFAVVPKKRVLGGVSSNGLIANSGNADGLTLFVNRSGGAGRVAGE